ncbi:hypothetical protein [Virgibacillus siamensis]|uniref:hypothetical protein n=1 Tax=Virgibacillus siamensis TaxID=480071 RepID=UPI0009871889|nr:hypothetical protein [Virgibacillus siamensis]
MNKQLQETIEYTQEKLGLEQYDLKQHQFYQETNHFNETIYILSMEWLPNTVQNAENVISAGAAVVDLNFHTKEFTQITFVQGVSYAAPDKYPLPDTESAIEWIEEQTGLTFGRQFLLIDEDDGVLRFGAAVDNIPVSPVGTIEIAFNAAKQLTDFRIDGDFPDESRIQWEPFALTPEKFEPCAGKQCVLMEIPDESEKKWKAYYGIEEIFIRNDGKTTIPFVRDANSSIVFDMVLEWDEALDEAFVSQETDFSTEATVEMAIANKPHPDAQPISEEEQKACAMETLHFLQKVYPDDSGQWKLTKLSREKGYLFAELRPTEPTGYVFERKVRVIIDPDRLAPVNYIDNKEMLQMFNDFQEADLVTVGQEDAFKKLQEHLEIDPVYVYDDASGSYVLCGKLDCAYAVDAVTGETILLGTL